MIAKKSEWNPQGIEYDCEARIAVRCPFHQENTPSCTIDFRKATFQCFGCGAKGYIGEDDSLFTEESGGF